MHPSNLHRRQFLKQSFMAGATLALSGLIPGCVGGAHQQLPEIDYTDGINLRNCNIVDVNNGTIIDQGTIMIRKGIIDLILDHKPPHSYGAIEIDMQHQYVLPGLIDAHCHTTMPSASNFNVSQLMANYRQIQRNYIQQIQSGVTTVRDMGALPLVLEKMVNKIASGQLPGPRVKFCNAVTNAYGGHPDIDLKDVSFLAPFFATFTGQSSLWYTDTKDLVQKFKKNVEKASFVKLALDDISILCGKGKIPSYTQEQLNIIFRLADEYNLPVAAHILTKHGFDRGIKYGLHSMEHTIGDAVIDDRDISQLAEKGCAIVPTMIMAQIFATEEAISKLPQDYRNNFILNELKLRRDFVYTSHDAFVEPVIHRSNQKTLAFYRQYGCENLYRQGMIQSNPRLFFGILKYGPEHLRKMHNAGVLIGCGTDAGVPFIYHGMIFLELEMLARIGFSTRDVIRFATINNAKILRMDAHIGSIEQEKMADIMVVKDNPFNDLKTLQKPSIVIKEGRIVFVRNGSLKYMNSARQS
ncbi:MAG: amidohydrolase family protein [Candidatus Magnetomorum sp.]|nr:amidohydrolase family protein [Candidatus Magnetomorum sp.]